MGYRLLGLLAALGFVASLAVHIHTFWGVPLAERFPEIWMLHLGMFGVFFPLVLALRRDKKAGVAENYGRLRKPARAALTVLGIYTFGCVMVSFASYEGSPEARGDRFVLSNHGRVVRELSRDEFMKAEARSERSSSAVWLLFYGHPALYFCFRRDLPIEVGET